MRGDVCWLAAYHRLIAALIREPCEFAESRQAPWFAAHGDPSTTEEHEPPVIEGLQHLGREPRSISDDLSATHASRYYPNSNSLSSMCVAPHRQLTNAEINHGEGRTASSGVEVGDRTFKRR
jgi:hypothetical protein